MGLHILIADHVASDLQLVGQYLMRAGHKVESSAEGQHIASIMAYQQQLGQDYDTILLRSDLPGPATVDILHAVRNHGVQCPAMIMYDPLNGALDHEQLRALHCTAYLQIPLDLLNVQERIEALVHAKADPFTQNYQRTPSNSFHPPTRTTQSTQISARRPIADSGSRPSKGTTGYFRKTGSQRKRRSVTGRVDKVDTDVLKKPEPDRTHTVRCAHCQQTFRVPIRPDPFNVACIHCGQLNRILPPAHGS